MATFIVNTTADEFDGSVADGDVSLRDAIAAANAAPGADRIEFDAAVFDGEAADILRLTQGQIAIADELTIDGGAGVTITGDANGDDLTLAGGITDLDASIAGENRLDDNSRIFNVTAPLTLDGLTLTGGRTIAASDNGGGAVRTTAALTLINSSISGNSTGGHESLHGGGIYAEGSVAVTNSIISGNSTGGMFSPLGGFSDDSGGGIFSLGTVTVTDSTISNNYAYAGGGGIRGRVVDVTNSTISDNYSYGGGGGIEGVYVSAAGSTFSGNRGGDGPGGAISANEVTAMNSTFSGNSAAGVNGSGGAISGDTVIVSHSTISGNYGYGSSGGINGSSVTLINSILLGNAYFDGASDVKSNALIRIGRNIIGGDVFSGDTDVGDTSVAAVFSETTDIIPRLGPPFIAGLLADNGGPTETIALRLAQDNPAIGGADPAHAPSIDQRGVLRDSEPDLGAFEAEDFGPPEPFRVEAETFARKSGFRVENVAAASGGQVIKSPSPAVEARASYTFMGEDGTYDLDLGYFDETDGRSRLSVFVDGVKIDRFAFRDDLGSKLPNDETKAVRHIAEVELEAGDVIEFVGRSNRDEPLRIDYLDFTPVDEPPSLRVEAETFTRVSGFREEDVAAASGGKVIKSPFPAVEARASFIFMGEDGTYDLDLGYFDETDGRSRLSVFVDGIKIDRFAFRDDLGSKLPNAETTAVRHITDVELEAGDVIELVGRSNRDEPLRIDYIDFTQVDDLFS